MAYKNYKQYMTGEETTVDFEVEGESYFLLSHPGSTERYDLSVVLPDGELVNLIDDIAAHVQQRLVVPAGTHFRITGTEKGAKVWVGNVYRTRQGQLIGG